MHRPLFSAAALVAALVLAAPAFAQFTDYYTRPSVGGTETPGEVGEPHDPNNGMPLLKGYGPPANLPGYVAGRPVCAESLGHLRRISAAAVRRSSGLVQVAPVCARQNLADQQDGIDGLRGAVAGNEVMHTALRQAGYGADDVVGVVLDGRGALLYVHAR